jgi:hypothetical protein
MDQCIVYDINLHFLTFPRSNSYLVTESIGVIKIKNESNQTLVLQGQKRRGTQRSNDVNYFILFYFILFYFIFFSVY